MTPAQLLVPHAKRSIRAFLRAPDPGNNSSREIFDAFWALVYGSTVVDHATAVAVERELVNSDRHVSEILEGWRPEALLVDPTPWCHVCGATTKAACKCGPIAANE